MPDYRRWRVPGGTYFFTVNLLERRSALLVREIEALREAVRRTRRERPFRIDGWVVLPEHLHCVITLPEGDADFSNWANTADKRAFAAATLSVCIRSRRLRVPIAERGLSSARTVRCFHSILSLSAFSTALGSANRRSSRGMGCGGASRGCTGINQENCVRVRA